MKPIWLLSAAFLLLGAGCDLSTKIELKNPFAFMDGPSVDSASSSLAIKREAGATIDLRPSYLGVTGTIADLVGSGAAVHVAIDEADASSAKLSWKETKEDKERTGTIAASGFADAQEMLLPAFWKDGDVSVQGNSVLWMSTEAFLELMSTKETEWRLGLGGEKTVAGADTLLKAFNAAAAKITGSSTASATATSPFTLRFESTSDTFPLRRDGKSEPHRVVFASSWFADYVILDNPGSPLILRVSVKPVALTALNTLSPLGVDPKAVGYEVTAVTTLTPPASP